MAFGIDQNLAVFGLSFGGAGGQGLTSFLAAAAVDDDGPQLLQHPAQQGKLLQVIAGDEGQVVELVVGGESVAPALMFRGDDEGARGQPFLAPHIQPDAGENRHGLDHPPDIGADDPAGGAASRRQGGEGGGQAIADRQDPVGDIEGEAAHGPTMAESRGSGGVFKRARAGDAIAAAALGRIEGLVGAFEQGGGAFTGQMFRKSGGKSDGAEIVVGGAPPQGTG